MAVQHNHFIPVQDLISEMYRLHMGRFFSARDPEQDLMRVLKLQWYLELLERARNWPGDGTMHRNYAFRTLAWKTAYMKRAFGCKRPPRNEMS